MTSDRDRGVKGDEKPLADECKFGDLLGFTAERFQIPGTNLGVWGMKLKFLFSQKRWGVEQNIFCWLQ